MSSNSTPEETAVKMDALGVWSVVHPCNWIVKPLGTAFPYFCTCVPGEDGSPVRERLLMLEGWQTFHDYIRTRLDPSFGFYMTPMEMPHFELVFAKNGEMSIYRDDPGYVPRALNESERALVARILWEAYGVMMRLEARHDLTLSYADERAMFARVEVSPGAWEDRPMEIPQPRPHVEKVSFSKALLAKAKDVPFVQNERLELDFRILPNIATNEPRPRCAYQLLAIDAATGERVFADRTSVVPDGGLRRMWESLPPCILNHLVKRGHVPGEIRLKSGRVFRLLRPLCMELPFKLSLHDELPRLDAAFKA